MWCCTARQSTRTKFVSCLPCTHSIESQKIAVIHFSQPSLLRNIRPSNVGVGYSYQWNTDQLTDTTEYVTKRLHRLCCQVQHAMCCTDSEYNNPIIYIFGNVQQKFRHKSNILYFTTYYLPELGSN